MSDNIVNAIVNSQNAENIAIYYKNGIVVEGFLSSVKDNFQTVSIQPQVGDPHFVEFDKIEKVIVTGYRKEPVITLNNPNE